MYHRDKCHSNREGKGEGQLQPDVPSRGAGMEGDQLDRGLPGNQRLRDKLLLDSEDPSLGGELSILASLADAERHRSRDFTGCFPLMEVRLHHQTTSILKLPPKIKSN